MKIKTAIEPVPGMGGYSIRFAFEDFTEEEIYLFGKYGFIFIDVPDGIRVVNRGIFRVLEEDRISLEMFPEFQFLFYASDKDQLKAFEEDVLIQVQMKTKEFLTGLSDFAAEKVYEVTATGDIRKITEGAKKALDPTSPEFREVIQKNREAFEKLSKL